MKLEQTDFDVKDYISRRGGSVKASASYTIVEALYPEFRKLMGTTKARVIDMKDDEDTIPWPSIDAFRSMEQKERLAVIMRMKAKLCYILPGLSKKLEPHYIYKYKAACTYIGNGKAAIWWRYILRTKKGKKELS